MKSLKPIFLIYIFFAISACKKDIPEVPNPQPSVYYWRTTFKLDNTELSFIKNHNIKKIYLKYFDVVCDSEAKNIRPVATLQWLQPIPTNIEIIPTVFIDHRCLKGNINAIADKLVKRVWQMDETNDVKNVKELQIDCDYTLNNIYIYYKFLRIIRQKLKSKKMILSITIRLHQLSMTQPPVDYGVLMMYNTGNYKNERCINPILNQKDIQPYLHFIDNYKLPLCAAYPNYKWQLLYKKNKFKAILYNEDLNDRTIYRKINNNKYVVIQSRELFFGLKNNIFSTHISVGDSIHQIQVNVKDILEIKNLLNLHRNNINNQVIIYNLDHENINRYNNNEYEEIFNH